MESAKEVFRRAIKLAHGAGRKTALSLSGPFCVDRFREDFKGLIENHIDILFANGDGICSLYQANSYEGAREAVQGKVEIAVSISGVKGFEVITADGTVSCPIVPVKNRIDTTGTDLFAAGFLYGFTTGKSMQACALLNFVAAAVIQIFGARLSAEDLDWVKLVV